MRHRYKLWTPYYRHSGHEPRDAAELKSAYEKANLAMEPIFNPNRSLAADIDALILTFRACQEGHKKLCAEVRKLRGEMP